MEVKKNVIKNLLQYKKEGRRIIAVGTTSVRALETIFFKAGAVLDPKGTPADLLSSPGTRRALARRSKMTEARASVYPVRDYKGWIDTFIYPGYKFKFIDGMITNFHLPKSTLLMLVSAFAGLPFIKKTYKEAVKNKYRFYSFGDGMLIL